MGKTYEALEKAEKEYRETYLGISNKPRKTSLVTATPKQSQFRAAIERCEALKTTFLNRYSDLGISSKPRKTGLVTGNPLFDYKSR